jgi:hypothetical protein
MNITAEQQSAATIFWYYFQPKCKMRAFSLIYQLNELPFPSPGRTKQKLKKEN